MTTENNGRRGRWCNLLCITMLLPVVFSCTGSDHRFKIEGEFKNMNQGQFYLVNMDHGTKDTIALRDGRFTYNTTVTDTTTLMLIFPNFSELPIFAQPGGKATIKGDASHLKETEVKGTDDNKLMTAFRLKTNDMMPPDIKQEAENTITQHPKSPVAIYLLRRYFIMGNEPDYPKAFQLATLMFEAGTPNVATAQLYHQLEALKNMTDEGRIPAFRATDTNGKTISNASLKSQINVICLWASWNPDSHSMLRQLKKLQDNHPGKISVITICTDASLSESRIYLERDSLPFPNICDGKLWESPVIQQLSLAYMPDNIVTDSTGTILARGLGSMALKEKIESLLR